MIGARNGAWWSKDNCRCSDQGQDMVEFALVVPIVVLLILGIMELGILVLGYNTVSNAAREGARYGIVHPTANGSGQCNNPGSNSILAATCALTTGLDKAAVQVTWTKTEPSGANPGHVTVLVTYDADLILAPFFQVFGINTSVPLSASATMDREQ